MKVVDIVTSVNRMGRILLRSGAETSRAELLMKNVCKSFNLEAQSFVSNTCIITSVKTEDGNIVSAVEKVQSISNNLNRIDRIHNLCLDIDNYTFEEYDAEVKKIEFEQRYSELSIIICYFFGAAFFCLLFKGGLKDALVSGSGGVIVFFVCKLFSSLQITNFFLNIFCGFLSTTIASLVYRTGFIETPSYSSIGTIMLLVPGLALTNAIRDLVNGDLISGVARAAEAFLVGTALGIGTGVSLYLFA